MEHTIQHCDPCRNCYKSKGCRCPQCTKANAVYETNRQRIRKRPDSDWDNPLVSADRARNHLVFLAQHGIGTKAVARATKLHVPNVCAIRSGKRKRITKKTELKIISLATGMFDLRPQDALRAKNWADKLGHTKYKLSNKD